MVVNLIVLLASLLVAGFLAVWLVVPGARAWLEAPKHRFLKRQREFSAVERGPANRADPADHDRP